ncbi:MAG: lipopolysaccharide biosynthesis protein [Chloroflexota bacterium]
MQRRFIRDLLAYLPSKVLPALTAFITVPIFTRLFRPDEYGNYILAFGVAQLMIAIYSGYGAGTVRFYSNYEVKGQLCTYFTNMFTSIAIMTVFGIGLGAGSLLLLRQSIPTDTYPLLWLAVGVFAATAWFHTLTLVIRAQEHSLLYTIFELAYRYGVVVVSLGLVLGLGLDIAGLLWGEIIVLIALALVMLWLLRSQISVRLTHLSRVDMTRFWQFAWPLTLGNFAMWGIRLSDRYIIEAFHGSAEVGLYSVSYNISSRTIDLLVNLIMLVPAPIIMRIWEEQGREDTESYLQVSARVYFMLLIPAVVGVAVLAQPIVYLLADPAYLDGHRAVSWVALSSLLWGLGQLGSFGMLVHNRTRLLARNQFFGLLAGIGINLLLIPHFGFMGAAFSACITMFLLAVLQIHSSASMLTWYWPVRTLLRVGAAVVVMAAAVHFSVIAQGTTDTLLDRLRVIGVGIIVGGLTYGLALVTLGEVSIRQVIHLFTPPASESTEHADIRSI